jgi:peptidyl-prolyl cis-trans isomerase NIMA-interacting 1
MAEELDAAALADAVNAAVNVGYSSGPQRLPVGWITKESSSNPSYFYYYNTETGLSSWHPPLDESDDLPPLRDEPKKIAHEPVDVVKMEEPVFEPSAPEYVPSTQDSPPTQERATKRVKTSSSSTLIAPKEVRVLHILKKHKDSRRPSSWRQPTITQSLEEAREELSGLLDILLEVESDPEELRATFEELARTESDCSSAKRGGDLGFFGRRKMQPAFEEASFALEIGELTKELVETSSGVHLILRIG